MEKKQVCEITMVDTFVYTKALTSWWILTKLGSNASLKAATHAPF